MQFLGFVRVLASQSFLIFRLYRCGRVDQRQRGGADQDVGVYVGRFDPRGRAARLRHFVGSLQKRTSPANYPVIGAPEVPQSKTRIPSKKAKPRNKPVVAALTAERYSGSRSSIPKIGGCEPCVEPAALRRHFVARKLSPPRAHASQPCPPPRNEPRGWSQ